MEFFRSQGFCYEAVLHELKKEGAGSAMKQSQPQKFDTLAVATCHPRLPAPFVCDSHDQLFGYLGCECVNPVCCRRFIQIQMHARPVLVCMRHGERTPSRKAGGSSDSGKF